MSIDIVDDRIFCNDAGDDEDLRLLNHYFVERHDFNRFYDRATPFRIVKARKGTGKSALLRRAETLAQNVHAVDLFVACKGAEIVPDFSEPKNRLNPINAWQRSMCARINRAIGARVNIAITDDQMMLVEAAELDNFRGRNLLSSLVDRLKLKFEAPGLGEVGLERNRPVVANEVQLLSSVAASGGGQIWLFVDDIDATFSNTQESVAALSAFFSACRDLVQKVSGLVIRCAVRTDVWTILRRSDESLDKCEQYVFNLRWDVDQVASILINKVYSYCTIVVPGEVAFRSKDSFQQKSEAFYAIFPGRYPWGATGSIESQKYLALYSQGRPRWTAKLCRYAATKAYQRGHHRIEEADVRSVLAKYSAERRADIAGEHSHEYSDFNGLLQILSGWKRKFSTADLLARISSHHLKLRGPEAKPMDAVQLAHLLFRSGVLNAVKDKANKRTEYLEYEDRPSLLTARANLDEGYQWEIPMYLRAEFLV